MKLPPIYAVLICAGLMTSPPHLSGQAAPPAATNALGPKITFDTNEYQFGKILQGTLVKHVFIVSNAGDQTLEISKVAPSCHCTTAGDWAHKLEPGQTGEIPIQFDSGNFLGNIAKSITVTSNDKQKPTQSLYLRGTIWQLLEVKPQFPQMNIMPDAPSNSTSIVLITSHSDELVTLSDPISANGSFKANLRTLTPGKEFELTVTAVEPFPSGNTTGTISIKTSLTNMPVLNVTVIALVPPLVSVVPAMIELPAETEHWTTNRVTITNNGSKPLILSDAEVSDKRISVEIKETTPWRAFQILAIFPPGFQIDRVHPMQLSVKSNNPKCPVITVPIRLTERPPLRPSWVVHPKPMSQNPPPPKAAAHP